MARLLLLVLLFAQSALALSACLTSPSAIAQAFATAPDDHCKGKKPNLNLCLTHCTVNDQTTDNAAQVAAVPTASNVPVLIVPEALPPLRVHFESVRQLAHAPDPPIPIRFCSFLI